VAVEQWRANLLAVDRQGGGDSVDALVSKSVADFEAGMVDDLNTPRACAALFGLVKGCEKLLKADAMDVDGECSSGVGQGPGPRL
jgi:cysteinyl-tRNA synthetase